MKNRIIKHTESILVSIVWMIVLVAPLFLFEESGDFDWTLIFTNWKSILPFFILFLINHFVFVPYLLFRNKRMSYFFASIATILIFSMGLHIIELKNQKNNRPENAFNPPPHQMEQNHRPPGPPPLRDQPNKRFPYPPYVNSFFIGLLIIGLDTGARMNFRWSKLEKERNQMEKENIQNQLAFLRNQVSPHFFMNTLNNIHSLIDINTEEAKEAIIKLSKLMRHLLYDSNTDQIALENELDFITSYINLMKLRFSDKVHIDVKIPADIPSKKIPPLLFTSFVENAFKHGISYQNESHIHISFIIDNEQLTFLIVNSIPDNRKEEIQNGIGIENSRKRLDLLYGNDYTLDIEESKNEYQLRLNIPL